MYYSTSGVWTIVPLTLIFQSTFHSVISLQDQARPTRWYIFNLAIKTGTSTLIGYHDCGIHYLPQPIKTIKNTLPCFLTNHFRLTFQPDKPCSFHYYCPCARGSATPSATMFWYFSLFYSFFVSFLHKFLLACMGYGFLPITFNTIFYTVSFCLHPICS